jgi:hypothetical protein
MENSSQEQLPQRREFEPNKKYCITSKPDGSAIILPDGVTKVKLSLYYSEDIGKWIATIRAIDSTKSLMGSMPRSRSEDPIECIENLFESSKSLTQVRNFTMQSWQEE